MMVLAAHQPHYLPWLRYVDKIARSDIFVLLDDVQYTKNGWQNRTRVKTPQGWTYLTVPVRDPFGKAIRDVRIDAQERWRPKHWKTICLHYARAPHLARHRDALASVYARPWESLHECSEHALRVVLAALGLRTPLVRSSELDVPGRGTERLVRICRALGADVYLTGDYAAANHLDLHQFARYGIEVRRQGWRCPAYRQQHARAGFVPDLSIVDLLLNEGEASLSVLGRGEAGGGGAGGRHEPAAAAWLPVVRGSSVTG